ncbi:MAG: gamma-glutamyltransferase, partial [Marinobacter vinifirmus]
MDRVNHSLLKKIPLRGLWRLTAASLFAVATTAAAASNQAILEGERFHPVQGKNGMVATSHTLASEVALQVLKNDGNAIDAAVTAGFALAVTQPRSGNIGGG